MVSEFPGGVAVSNVIAVAQVSAVAWVQSLPWECPHVLGAAPHQVLMVFIYFLLFRATPVAYGGSQARGPIRATATGYSNAGSEPHLHPTPQLTAMPDP